MPPTEEPSLQHQENLKMQMSSVVKSISCSCARPEFCSQNHISCSQKSGIQLRNHHCWASQGPGLMCTYPYAAYTKVSTNKSLKNTNETTEPQIDSDLPTVTQSDKNPVSDFEMQDFGICIQNCLNDILTAASCSDAAAAGLLPSVNGFFLSGRKDSLAPPQTG